MKKINFITQRILFEEESSKNKNTMLDYVLTTKEGKDAKNMSRTQMRLLGAGIGSAVMSGGGGLIFMLGRIIANKIAGRKWNNKLAGYTSAGLLGGALLGTVGGGALLGKDLVVRGHLNTIINEVEKNPNRISPVVELTLGRDKAKALYGVVRSELQKRESAAAQENNKETKIQKKQQGNQNPKKQQGNQNPKKQQGNQNPIQRQYNNNESNPQSMTFSFY